MKVLFLGTPDFSAVVLRALAARYEVTAVVTNPDRPAGRGHKTRPSAASVAADELGIPVFKFASVSREGLGEIRSLGADIAVTAAFGQILSEEFISTFPKGVLNVHASLLPRLRGASPVQWAILGGDEVTGVTIMRTVKALDAGDILLAESTRIGEDETAGELMDRLAVMGGELICRALALVESGEAVFTPQDDAAATYCHTISKADGRMDFTGSAAELERFVRGMTPSPSAYFYLNGKRIKVLAAKRCEMTGAPGEVLAADIKRGLVVGCGGGSVRLTRIMPEGKGAMNDTDWLRGNAVAAGSRAE